jgi:hypothetical protein
MNKKVAQINTEHLPYRVYCELSELFSEDSAMELYDGVELSVLMPDSEFIILIKNDPKLDEPINLSDEAEAVLRPIVKWAISQDVGYIHFSYGHERIEELAHHEG